MSDLVELNRDWIATLNKSSNEIEELNVINNLNRFLQEDGAYLIKLLPLPLVFNKNDFEKLSHASKVITQAQTKILKNLNAELDRTGILNFFDMNEKLKSFINWDELIQCNWQISRFDIIPSDKGYSFCEFNFGSPVGGSEEFDCFSQYMREISCSTGDSVTSPRKAMAKLIKNISLETDIENIVLFVMSKHQYLGYFSLEQLKSELEKEFPDISVEICNENDYPEDLLEPSKGNKSLVYRMFLEEDVLSHYPFFEKLWQSSAIILSSFESEIRMNKKWLSLLHDDKYRNLMELEERKIIDLFVPYTFTLAEKYLKSTVKDKDKYIFKMKNSFGGQGILIGKETPEECLQSSLLEAGLENWTVQTLISSSQLLLPDYLGDTPISNNLVLGLFIISDECIGMNVRASDTDNIVNVKTGKTRSGWAFPVDTQLNESNMTVFKESIL